jgi:capsular polysaccharide biosynthesis protein
MGNDVVELRRYWQVFRRRWLLIFIPSLVVLGIGLATYQSPPPVYNVGARFLVAQPPGAGALTDDEQRYFNWLSSEYIVNGLTDWVRGGKFAEAVSAALAEEGLDVPPHAIQGGLAADNARSMLLLSMTYGDGETLAAMMATAVTLITEENAAALPQLGGETAVIIPLDPIHVNQIPAGIRSQLDLPLRLAIALAAGIGLALLVEYLDPTLRDRREVEALDLPILGEIPKK